MNNTVYQTQKSKSSLTVHLKKLNPEIIINKTKVCTKKLTDSFGPKNGFRCF